MGERHCGQGERHCQIHLGPPMSYKGFPYLLAHVGFEDAHVHKICHQIPYD